MKQYLTKFTNEFQEWNKLGHQGKKIVKIRL